MNLNDLTIHCQSYIKNYPDPYNFFVETFVHFYPELVQCITQHNHLYYIQANPIISDQEYDQLFSYLKKIEKYHPILISQDSPTQNLDDQRNIQTEFNKAPHHSAMLSLENSYNATDIQDRYTRASKILQKESDEQNIQIDLYLEPKIDGISIELIYDQGNFLQAITRGDGIYGEDVTNNVKTIKNIPHQIPYKAKIAFRGEIIIGRNILQHINKQREIAGQAPFANTRNLAAGSLKQLDPNITQQRALQCYIYEISSYPQDQHDYREFIQQQGFDYLSLGGAKKIYDNIQEVIDLCQDPSTSKKLEQQYPLIDCDGLVIKIDQITQRHILGSTDHHPRWAIAYKFPAQQVSTQIQKIDYQISRSGIITPVAHLSPVELSGATIAKASLHNFDFIKNKDIRQGDRVWIQRSGEVIPYIVSVIKERRSPSFRTKGNEVKNLRSSNKQNNLPPGPSNLSPIFIPTHCPSCNTVLQQSDVFLFCPNHHECIQQIIQQIIHFASKQAMNIDGLGDKIVEILVIHEVVKSIPDIYSLISPDKQRRLRSMPGFGHKRGEELKGQIEKSKENELRRFLNALGLPGIGKKLAKELARHYTTSNQLTLLSFFQNAEILRSIFGIGETIIQDLNLRSQDPYNISLLHQLEKHGLHFSTHGSTTSINTTSTKQSKEPHKHILDTEQNLTTSSDISFPSNLQNKHFSITGSFDIPRPHIIQTLEAHGAIFDNNPTKKTDFILIGEKPGSKYDKAQSLGITLYNNIPQLTQTYPQLSQIFDQKTIDKKQKNNIQPPMASLF